jgi:hypothetical protein
MGKSKGPGQGCEEGRVKVRTFIPYSLATFNYLNPCR